MILRTLGRGSRQGKPEGAALARDTLYAKLAVEFVDDARFKLKDFQGALDDYSTALSINPENENAFFGRGNARFKLKDFQGAYEDFQHCIDLEGILSRIPETKVMAKRAYRKIRR